MSDVKASEKQLHILQHSLGVDKYGQGERYRNHFVTGEDTTDYPECMALVSMGLMMKRGSSPLTGGDYLFQVTLDGQSYVTTNSPNPPKLTPAQGRYKAWLDADCDMPFGEWIKAAAQ